tara:strand:- start:66 stop:266 length:201 start_codon:yes stop_codon:yes gene_type:complete
VQRFKHQSKINFYTSTLGGKEMTKEQAQEIIQDIVEAAYLNARDIDPEQAKQIDQAAEIVFQPPEQ